MFLFCSSNCLPYICNIMKRAVVIGASSGIGRQVAQLLIQDGWSVGLAARREFLLQELKQMAPGRIVTSHIDVTDGDCAEKLLDLISSLGGMHLFFYSTGVGWQNSNMELAKEFKTMDTNVMGFTRMVGTAFEYFKNNAGGHIAVISSIAGTKGLGPAPSYSASKALQNTYIEALEQLSRTQKLNISFTDIRPGFVDTPLLRVCNSAGTEGKQTCYPMLMNSGKVAKYIVMAINKNRKVVIIDWRWRIVTILWRFIPRCIWIRMKL